LHSKRAGGFLGAQSLSGSWSVNRDRKAMNGSFCPILRSRSHLNRLALCFLRALELRLIMIMICDHNAPTSFRMKPPEFRYLAPRTIAETMQCLQELPGRTRLLAGGQSLMPMLSGRTAATDFVLDLNRLDELQAVVQDSDGQLTVGAMTRHRQFERDEALRRQLPIIAYAMQFVASVAIRNRGTIGGSLCHADPVAEWPALCLACDAEVVTVSVDGSRRIPIDELIAGAFLTSLRPGELLTHVVFPGWPVGRRWSFHEVPSHVGGVALVGIACVIDVDEDRRCSCARVAVFGAPERATRLRSLEQLLVGRPMGTTGFADLARDAAASVVCRADLYASSAYRAELVDVLVGRALVQVFAASAGTDRPTAAAQRAC
jgi:carbon-monoxide dehydrogenase medium subunit